MSSDEEDTSFLEYWCKLVSPTISFVRCFIRDRPRFFDQVGHKTTNASIENKHFFTK